MPVVGVISADFGSAESEENAEIAPLGIQLRETLNSAEITPFLISQLSSAVPYKFSNTDKNSAKRHEYSKNLLLSQFLELLETHLPNIF